MGAGTAGGAPPAAAAGSRPLSDRRDRDHRLNRRQFLQGLAATGAGLAAAAILPGCAAPGPQPGPTPRLTSTPYYYRARQRFTDQVIDADVCIYGATVAGIAAAIQAQRLGMRVSLVEFSRHVGGMTTGGLSATDVGFARAIGGIAKEFYTEIGSRYGRPVAYEFEPRVAAAVIAGFLERNHQTVWREEHPVEVLQANGSISALRTDTGRLFKAKAFIDASYDGDLMAMAGVSYTVGREANSRYGESLNGIQLSSHHAAFAHCTSPSLTPAALLPSVSAKPVGVPGSADESTQAYCFRLCVTKDTRHGKEFQRPEGYDVSRYELLLRHVIAGTFDALSFTVPLPHQKLDLNSTGAVSTDNVGMSSGWPRGTFEARESIFQDHVNYQQGLLWFLANDPRLPQRVRDSTRKLRLAGDEFVETGGWPPQLYVREARRMVSDSVMTEANVRGKAAVADSIGLGAYSIDSHPCQRVVVSGCVTNEGAIGTAVPGPYRISYGAIVPREAECQNLLVPVCLSASHVAWCSIRTEPALMTLGQSAGAAAAIAVRRGTSVQKVDYAELRSTLMAARQVLA